MMTYTGYRNDNPQKRDGPIDFSTYLMQNDEMLSDMGLLKEIQDIIHSIRMSFPSSKSEVIISTGMYL